MTGVTRYKFVSRLGEGIVGLSSSYGDQMFVRSKIRKNNSCELCCASLKPGDQAYRPITNGYNRMHRLCVACVQELESA